MSNIHLIMTGKGGVGKSFVAACQMQTSLELDRSVIGIDTDPVNKTFAAYKALNVIELQLIKEGTDEINKRAFDQLIEIVCEQHEKGVKDIIVDNGASSFVPLASYLLANDAINFLTEMGHTVTLHCIIASGQAQLDTLTGLDEMAKKFQSQDCGLVVWLNEYEGKIEGNGKPFTEMKVFKQHSSAIKSVISLGQYDGQLHGADVRDMLTKKLTFNEAIESGDFSIMQKQRLKLVKKNIIDAIKAALYESELETEQA